MQTDMRVGVARGERGMVSSGHAHGTDAALEILREGGNAVDAAVAAALVLAVVCPYATTLGSDLYAIVYDPRTHAMAGLNASGRSPAATGLGPPARSGPRSATVPALLRGLADLLHAHGTLPFARLAARAIALAAEGFIVHPALAENTRDRAELLARDAAAGELFLPGGEPLREGTLFVQPDLANVLSHVAAGGVDAFYAGDLTNRFVRACAQAGGVISADDFAEHRSLWQKPLGVPFYDREVWTMPPNSYGPTLLLQLLDLQRMRIDTVDPGTHDFIDAGIEARRRAYAAAAAWIGDPGATEPLAAAFIADAVERGSYDAPGKPVEPRDRCTTNVIVIDHTGLAVSLVESVSAPYGSGVVVAGTGVLLNNRIGGFTQDPAHPNGVGPRKRPANTLAPCVVTRGNRLTMALGTPGTVGQTCTLAQFLARTLACGESLAGAAAAPRWSVDFEGRPIVEDTMDERLRAAVLERHPGARVMPSGWTSFGSIKLAAVDTAGYEGVADYRRVATTAGW